MTRAEGFAAIPTWMLREQTLSIHAVMVYASLASRAGLGGIYPSRETIAREARCSVRKVADALNELDAAGVVERVKRRSKAGQATSGYRLIPQGNLRPEEFSDQEAHGAFTLDEGARGARGEGTREQITPLIEVDSPEVDTERLFAEFWSAYPRKVAKPRALKAFIAAAKETAPEVIVAGAVRYAKDPNLPEKQFIPHPASWLNDGRWDDEPLPPRIHPSAPAPAPRTDDFDAGEEFYAWGR